MSNVTISTQPRLSRPLADRISEALTREYFQDYDRWVKWVRKPLPLLAVAAIASGLCGTFLHPRAYVFSIGLTTIVLLGIVWPWLTIRGVAGSLAFERNRAREGESVGVSATIRNRAPWSAWGLTIRGAAGSNIGAPRALGWRKTEARWDVRLDCRGEYPTGDPRIATAFPFGLKESSRELRVADRLLVWPRTFPVGPIPESAQGQDGDGVSSCRKPGTSGETIGTRPYRRGDSPRGIHWPQTARQGALIVRERQALTSARVQIVLDVHPDGCRGTGPDGSWEWSIRVAASFAEDWIGQGADVEVVFGDQSILASTIPSRSRASAILDAFARLKPDRSRSLADTLASPACRRFRDGLRLIVAADSAFARLPIGTLGSKASECRIVLCAAGFDDPTNDDDLQTRTRTQTHRSAPSSLQPWIWIDDPKRAAQQIRHRRREARIGC